MLDEMDALARGPVAHEEIVYQDLAICKLALQHLGPPLTPAVWVQGTSLQAVRAQRLGKQFIGEGCSPLTPQLVIGKAKGLMQSYNWLLTKTSSLLTLHQLF